MFAWSLRAFFITDTSGKVIASASGEGVGVDLSTRPYLPPLKSDLDRVWSGSISGGLRSGDNSTRSRVGRTSRDVSPVAASG